jgi:arabinogalactan oligomer/maltooligosaccharide transport system substrate-binding protein
VTWRGTLLPLLLAAAACTRAPGAAADVTTITLWHAYSADERGALDELAARWNAAHPQVQLELVNVPYDAFSDKITAAIPNGNGPDLFVFAHDRVGDWAEAGLVEPIEFWVDEPLADRFDARPLDAMVYRGSLYGLPLAVKSLAMFWRTDLLDHAPATTDELLAVGQRFAAGGAGRFGLVYENVRLYAHAAWLHGFGGAIFDADGHPTLATPAARAAAAFARTLATLVPAEATATLCATLFNEGRAPIALSGPWFVGGVAPGLAWAVAPLPTVSATGTPAAPYLGAEGVMMSTRAHDKRAAFAVMDFLTSDAAAILRARRARQVVPNRAAYDDPAVRGDHVLAAFRAQAARAVPMPATPAMRMVWTPYDLALEKILAQGVDPGVALAEAQREVEGYLRGAGAAR